MSAETEQQQCWADGPDEYIVPGAGGGFEPTRQCTHVETPDCKDGLCAVHCLAMHGYPCLFVAPPEEPGIPLPEVP